MIKIIRTVYVETKLIKTLRDRSLTSRETERNRMLENAQRFNHDSKAMVVQCIGYIIATVIPYSIGFALNERAREVVILHKVYTVLRPSQGIFNFIVFFGQKIYDKHRLDATLTLKEAMKEVLFKKEETRVELEGLSLVALHRIVEENNNDNGRLDGVQDHNDSSNLESRDELAALPNSTDDPSSDILPTNVSLLSGAMGVSEASDLPSVREFDQNERKYYKSRPNRF